eukprot:TRINITY_DN83576_c0_g1_i1.p1 TRINITY_DN83576_c0_g1~~TRINITY_DN83576_c0_g1_i1.p1  ORF type:complete len:240 (-),score=49.67 TRINITY_DN83576_c0_g1_i1:442-1161(-)
MVASRRPLHWAPRALFFLLPGVPAFEMPSSLEGFKRPAPKCVKKKCEDGHVAAPVAEYRIWSHGCSDTGYKGAELNKCCVERDICRQTCGMSNDACHEAFETCKSSVCEKDNACIMQAMMVDMATDPADEIEKRPDYRKYGDDAHKCRGYHYGQEVACTCVPEKEYRPAVENRLVWFYEQFNPSKLNSDGSIVDIDSIWNKWGGKEPDMLNALTVKYKKTAVEMRARKTPLKNPAEKEL